MLRSLLVQVIVKPTQRPGSTVFDVSRVEVRPDWGPALEAAQRSDVGRSFAEAVPVKERLVAPAV